MQAFGMIGNWFAAVAILAWPIVAVALYRARPAGEATLWTVLGAYMMLPSGPSIKLEMIPALDKDTVPNVCIFLGCLIFASGRRSNTGFRLVECLAVMFIIGPVITSTLNSDTIVIGERILPGVGYYDGISALQSQLLLLLPFIIGRRIFRDTKNFETIVRCMALAGLFYSLPILLEIRLSPQLSNWIYGFFPSGFLSEVRYGGYRPVVFMRNGLTAAFFMMTTFLAAVAMWRLKYQFKLLPPAAASAYLGTIVVLCKSGGALLYAAVGGAFVGWMKPKAQLRLAVILAAIALLYPALRMTDLFPDKLLVEMAASIDRERADSLQIRFDQERQLLERASERFTFGWGRYGRSRVYEESGKDSTITDGAWIVTLGQFGLIGFVAEFGLLAFPVFRSAAAYKFVRTERDRVYLAVIALIVALTIVEQLPNSSVSSWSWLLAGALLGRAERIIALARRSAAVERGSKPSDARSAPVAV